MIYVTGDTHGDLFSRSDRLKKLKKDDVLIVCGDFGHVWYGSEMEERCLNGMGKLCFTILFADGNHENFPLLRSYPLEDRYGGQVRRIRDNVFHLERGQVFTIEEKRIFVMGGATSIDKHFRTTHVSWWPEEIPSYEEMARGLQALEDVGWSVDYVVTHCAPESILARISPHFDNDCLTRYLETVLRSLQFKRWFFGHYHLDREYDKRFYALYDTVMPAYRREKHKENRRAEG